MAGINVEEKEDMCPFILDVKDEFGTTIALIEHDMGVVMDISDRVVVLDYGRKIADGPPEEVRASPEVIAAYSAWNGEAIFALWIYLPQSSSPRSPICGTIPNSSSRSSLAGC